MDFRVEVSWKAGLSDGRAEQLKGQIASLGIVPPEKVSISDLYFLRGDLSPSDVELLCQHLLADPIVQGYTWCRLDDDPPEPQGDG